MIETLEKKFVEIGGTFHSPVFTIAEKARNLKALIFDWDGVFNSGDKGSGVPSYFNESDAMGTNLLRFGLYLQNGAIPYTLILTGANNETAISFAEREHFDKVYFKSLNKLAILDHFLNEYDLNREEVAFFYDDVLDLGVAQKCGLTFQISSHGKVLFDSYVTRNRYCDYKTGNVGGENGVREVCELILGLIGKYDEVVDERLAFTETYSNYLKLRNSKTTESKVIEV